MVDDLAGHGIASGDEERNLGFCVLGSDSGAGSPEFVHRSWRRWAGLEGGQGGGRTAVCGRWRRAVRRGIMGARPVAGGGRPALETGGGGGRVDEEDDKDPLIIITILLVYVS
jgi:hypothetical protein